MRATLVIGFTASRTEPLIMICVTSSATYRGEDGESGSLVTPVAIEGSFVLPGRPHDAGEPVGKSDGGLVVTAQAFTVERPTTQAIEGFAGAQ